MCLSLAPHVLIASAPRAYRSWPSSLSLAGRLLIARGVIDNAKVLHLGRALSDFVRQAGNIFEILLIFPRFEDDVTDGRGIKSLLVLQFGWKVYAVILADVADGIRWKFLGFRCDAEDFENLAPSGKVSAEGSGTDVGQSCQRAFADESFPVVIIDHKLFFIS